MNNCKRCGRELRSVESIKNGYGATCFRVVQLERTRVPEVNMSAIEELLVRVKKLELDNNFMKYQLKHKTTVSGKSKDTDLNWRARKQEQPEQTIIRVEMTVVIKELKVIFHEDFDYHEVLSPIELTKVEV